MKKLLLDWLIEIPENIDEQTTTIKKKLIQSYYENTCNHVQNWWNNDIHTFSTLYETLDKRFDFCAFKEKYNLDLNEFWMKIYRNPSKYQIRNHIISVNKEFNHYN